MGEKDKETVTQDSDEIVFYPPFLIGFFMSLLVAGVCGFLNVLLVNKLVKVRLSHIPKAKKVKVKKGKKGKKSKN